MKIRNLLLIVLVIGCMTRMSGQSTQGHNAAIQNLISMINDGRIQRIVLYQAKGIDANQRVSPRRLEVIYTCMLDYTIQTKGQRDKLVALLRTIRVSKNIHGADVRAGIIFMRDRFDDSADTGNWKYGIFSDQFGQYGYMGEIGKNWQLEGNEGRAVQINQALWNYISSVFSSVDK